MLPADAGTWYVAATLNR